MAEVSNAPNVSSLEAPMDIWSEPFWRACEEGRLMQVRCADCARYRWPPGPFCPHCQSQRTEWTPAGPARLYSFTLVRTPVPEGHAPQVHVPALVEFPDCDGMRLLAAVVDAPIAELRIGDELEVAWSRGANVRFPVFVLASKEKAG